MLIEGEKVRSEKYYTVGFIPSINKYVIADIVTWVAWYERYFEITKAEYELFGTDELDSIAEECHKQGIGSKRFLFSERTMENSDEQHRLREKACK